MFINIVLIFFLIACIYSDVRYRKIFNWLTMPVVVLGVGGNGLLYGMSGVETSLFGFVTGFLVLFIFYVMGGVGAGDIKFMAAVGSLKGASFVLMGGMYGAILAGAAAGAVLIVRGKFFLKIGEIGAALFCFFVSKNAVSLRFRKEDSVLLPYAALLSVGMLVRLYQVR
jgi:prepilin peptidase CpaA